MPELPFDVRSAKAIKRRTGRAARGSRIRSRATYRKKSGVFATPVSFSPESSGNTRTSVIQAAEVFATQARKNASTIRKDGGPATRVVAATGVEGASEQQAYVLTEGSKAPNAAPFEFGERHPVFGRPDVPRAKWTWRKMKQRDYMNRAATSSTTINAAAEAYANAEQILLAEEYGYNE
jgi:hypothetical protein